MMYDPNLVVPPEVIQAVQTIRQFAEQHTSGNDWQVGGLQPVQCSIGYYKARMEVAERKLDKADRERDELLKALESGKQVYLDIGNALGANMPAELVNEVARRRMAELAAARLLIAEVEDSEEGLLVPPEVVQAVHCKHERTNIEDMAVFALRRENAQLRAAGESMVALLDQMAIVMGSTPGDPNALLAAVRDLKARHDQRERELVVATKERDQLHRVVKFADARINRMLEERNPA